MYDLFHNLTYFRKCDYIPHNDRKEIAFLWDTGDSVARTLRHNVPAPDPSPSLLCDVKPRGPAKTGHGQAPHLLPAAVEREQGHEGRHLQQEVEGHRDAGGQRKGPYGGHGGQGA